MSDCVRSLVWNYYDEGRYGVSLIMLIALSDEADDRGGGIFQSIPGLARKTRQGHRTVQYQLRRLEEQGVLKCIDRSPGGRQFNHYQFDLSKLMPLPSGAKIAPLEDASGAKIAPLEVQKLHRSDPLTIRAFNTSKSKPSEIANAEDHLLAEKMFALLRRLNPKHRPPNWKTWCHDLRLLQDRDKRSPGEIAGLFEWCNQHPFWYKNIQCPATLRKHWDRLMIERSAPSATHSSAQTMASSPNSRCKWDEECCEEHWVIDGYCRAHFEANEKRKALGDGE